MPKITGVYEGKLAKGTNHEVTYIVIVNDDDTMELSIMPKGYTNYTTILLHNAEKITEKTGE